MTRRRPRTTYYVRFRGEEESTEHPTHGSAMALAETLAADEPDREVIVIRKTGRLTVVVARLNRVPS